MPETRPETLRPLPLRITQRTYLRLQAHRQIDQLAIQEHVRRALDAYLDMLDRKRPLERVASPVSAGSPSEPGEEIGMEKEKPEAASPSAGISSDASPGKQPAAADRVAKPETPRPRSKKANSKPQLAYR